MNLDPGSRKLILDDEVLDLTLRKPLEEFFVALYVLGNVVIDCVKGLHFFYVQTPIDALLELLLLVRGEKVLLDQISHCLLEDFEGLVKGELRVEDSLQQLNVLLCEGAKEELLDFLLPFEGLILFGVFLDLLEFLPEFLESEFPLKLNSRPLLEQFTYLSLLGEDYLSIGVL